METTTTRDRRIYVSDAGLAKLRQMFKTSKVTVWKSLTYRTKSPLANKIRYVALTQLGGTPTQWMPDCETTHEESARTMTQTWGKRVKLVFYKDSGNVIAYIDGRKDCELKNVSALELIELQQSLELKSMTMA